MSVGGGSQTGSDSINVDHHKSTASGPLCRLRTVRDAARHQQTRSHPEMVGRYVAVTLNFDLSKNSFCAFLASVKTYTHTKN